MDGNLFLLAATLELMNYELLIDREKIMLFDVKYLLFTGRND